MAYLQLPDGSYTKVDDGMSYDDALAAAQKKYPQLFGVRQKEGFLANLGKAARDYGEQSLGAIAEGVSPGTGRPTLQRNMDDQSVRSTSWEDVKGALGSGQGGLSTLGAFARDTLAGSLPQMGATMAGAGLGAKIGSVAGPVGTLIGGGTGALLASIPAFAGQNMQAQMQESPQAPLNRGAAFGAAVPQAALDAGSMYIGLGKLGFGKAIGKSLDEMLGKTTRELEEAAVREARRSVLASSARAAGRSILVEMPTEVAQQVLERAQAGRELLSSDALREYEAAAAGAAVLGGGMGVPSGIHSRQAAKQTVHDMERRQALEKLVRERQAEQERIAAERAAAQAQINPMEALVGQRAPEEGTDTRFVDMASTTPQQPTRPPERDYVQEYLSSLEDPNAAAVGESTLTPQDAVEGLLQRPDLARRVLLGKRKIPGTQSAEENRLWHKELAKRLNGVLAEPTPQEDSTGAYNQILDDQAQMDREALADQMAEGRIEAAVERDEQERTAAEQREMGPPAPPARMDLPQAQAAIRDVDERMLALTDQRRMLETAGDTAAAAKVQAQMRQLQKVRADAEAVLAENDPDRADRIAGFDEMTERHQNKVAAQESAGEIETAFMDLEAQTDELRRGLFFGDPEVKRKLLYQGDTWERNPQLVNYERKTSDEKATSLERTLRANAERAASTIINNMLTEAQQRRAADGNTLSQTDAIRAAMDVRSALDALVDRSRRVDDTDKVRIDDPSKDKFVKDKDGHTWVVKGGKWITQQEKRAESDPVYASIRNASSYQDAVKRAQEVIQRARTELSSPSAAPRRPARKAEFDLARQTEAGTQAIEARAAGSQRDKRGELVESPAARTRTRIQNTIDRINATRAPDRQSGALLERVKQFLLGTTESRIQRDMFGDVANREPGGALPANRSLTARAGDTFMADVDSALDRVSKGQSVDPALGMGIVDHINRIERGAQDTSAQSDMFAQPLALEAKDQDQFQRMLESRKKYQTPAERVAADKTGATLNDMDAKKLQRINERVEQARAQVARLDEEYRRVVTKLRDNPEIGVPGVKALADKLREQLGKKLGAAITELESLEGKATLLAMEMRGKGTRPDLSSFMRQIAAVNKAAAEMQAAIAKAKKMPAPAPKPKQELREPPQVSAPSQPAAVAPGTTVTTAKNIEPTVTVKRGRQEYEATPPTWNPDTGEYVPTPTKRLVKRETVSRDAEREALRARVREEMEDRARQRQLKEDLRAGVRIETGKADKDDPLRASARERLKQVVESRKEALAAASSVRGESIRKNLPKMGKTEKPGQLRVPRREREAENVPGTPPALEPSKANMPAPKTKKQKLMTATVPLPPEVQAKRDALKAKVQAKKKSVADVIDEVDELESAINRRNFLLGAAALAADPAAAADPTLGKAKPIDQKVWDGKVNAAAEKALRAGKLVDALDAIATSGPQEVRALAAQIAKLLPKTGFRVSVNDALHVNAHGAVSLKGGNPSLTLFTADGRHGLTHGTLLHEALHMAVAARYYTLGIGIPRENDSVLFDGKAPKASPELEQFRKVWDEFKEIARADHEKAPAGSDLKLSLREAIASPDEFLVRALTDADLQKYMAAREYKGKTLWDRFKDWVKTLLGVKTGGTAPSWLDAALVASNDLVTAMQKDAASFEAVRAVASLKSTSDKEQRDTLYSKREYADGFDPELQRAAETLIAKPNTFMQKAKANMLGFRMQFIDRFDPQEQIASRMDDNVKATQMMYWLRMYGQTNNFMSEIATNGTLYIDKIARPDGRTEYMVKSKKGANLRAIMEALQGDKSGNAEAVDAQFKLYMVAERAARVGYSRVAEDIPGGVSEADLKKALAAGRANPAFQKARDLYAQYNDGLIDFAEAAGALSSDVAKQLKASRDYVSFYRQNGDNVDLIVDGERIGTIGNLKSQPYLHELLGSDMQITGFVEGALRNTHLLTDMALRNIATRNTAETLADIGLAKIGDGPGPSNTSNHVVRFKSKGEDKYAVIDTDAIGVPPEMVVHSMDGIATQTHAVVKMLGIPARLLRHFIVRNPAYAVRQIFRDSTAAALMTGADVVPVLSPMRQLAKTLRGDGSSTLQERGIVGGQVITGDIEDRQNILKQMMAGKTGWQTAMARLDAIAMQADAATRQAIYEDARKKGMSDMEASLMALESMNFNRRGLSPTLHALGTMIPFMNAQIQGLDVLYRAMTGKMPFADRLEVQRKFFTRGLMLAGMTMAYAAAMEDDEDYKNASADERYNNWFIPIPGTDEKLKVPIPFEPGYLFKALPEAVYNLASDNDDARNVLDAFLQMGLNMMPGVIPQGVKPMIEAVMNRSFFTSKEIEDTRMRGLKAGERYGDRTTEMAKAIGGSFEIAGRELGVSPVMVEHMVRGYTGALGVALLGLSDALVQQDVEKPTPKTSQQPIVGPLFLEQDGSGVITLAYKRIEQLERAKNTFEKLVKEGRQREAEEFAERYADEIGKAEVGAKTKSALGKLTQAEQQIRAQKDVSGDEKRRQLDEIRRYKIELSRETVSALR